MSGWQHTLWALSLAVLFLTASFVPQAKAAAAPADLQIWANGSAAPLELLMGTTATISWSAPAFKNGTCSVYTGHPDGKADTIFNGSGSTKVAGQGTGTLFGDTRYTLSCTEDGRTRTAAVDIKIHPTTRDLFYLHPFATVSSLLFYATFALLFVPWTRRNLFHGLADPISPHQQHLAGFDAFRGFAAMAVALGHCWWATYPVFEATQQQLLNSLNVTAKAVPVFAVLSGFLIYRAVLSIRNIDDLRNYALRRFFRIYPVYALGVLMCAIAGQYVATAKHTALGMFTSDLFMFQVIAWPGKFANPPTWSLYIEVVFYVLLPLIVLAIGRKRMIPFCIVFIIAMLVADYDSRNFGLWMFFAAGIIASELSYKLKSKYFALALFAAGAALLYYDIVAPDYGVHDWAAHLGLVYSHGGGGTVGLALGCALILSGLPHLPEIGRTLSILPLRLLGTISYSVYIIHFFYILICFPALELFNRAGKPEATAYFETLPRMPVWYLPLVFFPGILFWGLVSYLLVERPGIQFGAWIINQRKTVGQTAH